MKRAQIGSEELLNPYPGNDYRGGNRLSVRRICGTAVWAVTFWQVRFDRCLRPCRICTRERRYSSYSASRACP